MDGDNSRRLQKMQRANYETLPRSELSAQQPARPRKTSMVQIYRLPSPDGMKQCDRYNWKTAALRSYPRLPQKFNTFPASLSKPVRVQQSPQNVTSPCPRK